MSELRFSVRRLLRQPASSVASVLTLALAIGASVATWSLLSALLIRPLPIADPDRVVVVGSRFTKSREPDRVSSWHVYPSIAAVRDTGVFDGTAASGAVSLLVTAGGVSQTRPILFVTAGYFELLGVSPASGRTFAQEEDRRDAPLVAMVSARFWRGHLGGDPAIVGRDILVASRPVRIIGVAGDRFRGLNLAESPDLFMPLHAIAAVGGPNNNYFAEPNHPSSPSAWISIVGRLGANLDRDAAAARLNVAIGDRRWSTDQMFVLTPANAAALPARAGIEQMARLLTGTVALLLLIGCFTVAMLLLVRTEARRGEFAVCLALGASRSQLGRGVVSEGALLAAAGAALSVPIAWWCLAGVRQFQLPGRVDIDLLGLRIDGQALIAAAIGALLTTVVVAGIAGLFGFSANIADVLRARTGTTRSAGRRTGMTLVAIQVAVSLVLVTGAMLFARSLIEALRLNTAADASRLVTASVSLQPYGYTSDRARVFFDDLATRLRRDPAIAAVSSTSSLGSMTGAIVIDGESTRPPTAIAFTVIEDRYFDTIGLNVVRGRAFAAGDVTGAPLVGIASESLARFISTGRDAIGRRITMPFRRAGAPPPVVEVIGVVPDLITSVTNLEPMVLYFPAGQWPPSASRQFVVRAAANAPAAASATLAAIREQDASITPPPLLSIDDRLLEQMGPQRLGATVMGAFGVVALVLTALGIYVMAESLAAARRREMGIRAALGATRRQLSALLIRQTGLLVAAGLAIGFALIGAGARLIRALLFRVEPLDAWTIAGVAALLLAVALAVMARPVLLVSRPDLAKILRDV